MQDFPLFTNAKNTIDLGEIFFSSPVVYSILFFLSFFCVSLFLYCLCIFRMQQIAPKHFFSQIHHPLKKQEYQKILHLCKEASHPFARILKRGVETRKSGLDFLLRSMQSEGKRSFSGHWQWLSLLHDIAVIAPMFGLLGTISGMFYAFYDINRSVESIHALFDGLGVAIGTTVMGLIVAIMAMVFYIVLKQRLLRIVHTLENESLQIGYMVAPEKE
ncbi:MAG: MotA/TolQ/ExbB proton channel family protein [Chlamydiota bacterium]